MSKLRELVCFTAAAGFAACSPVPGDPGPESTVAALFSGGYLRGFIADGTGCATLGEPAVSEDSVTFILTDYTAQLDGRGLARATCDLAVEVAVPPGISLSLDSVSYRGFADGSDARSTFYREYFFAGEFMGDRRFTVQQYDTTGNVTLVRDDSDQYTTDFGEFTAYDEVLSVAGSVCGETEVWRSNTSLSLRNSRTTSFSLASIDTVDVENLFFITFDFGPPAPCP